jgi:hypothetical protein
MKGTNGPWLRISLLFCAMVAFAGCTTGAQRQAQQTGVATREASAQFKTCTAAVISKPEYTSLLPHTPDLESGQPTMAQLTDETLPSTAEAKLFASRHDEINPCKSRFLSTLSTVRPDIAVVFADSFTAGTSLSVELVEQKITWAEWAKRGQALKGNLLQTRVRGHGAYLAVRGCAKSSI